MINFELNGIEFLLAVFIIFSFIIGLILIMRRYLVSNNSGSQSKVDTTKMKYRTKYPKADVNRYSGIFFRLGVLIAITIVFFAFSWTSYDINGTKALHVDYEPELIIEQIPNTFHEKKPKPKIPEIIIEIPEEKLDNIDDVELTSLDVFADESVYSEVVEQDDDPLEAPLLPLPKLADEPADLPFYIVEDNPRFPGCEYSDLTKKEKENCARKKLLEYIYQQLKYPSLARETGVEGTVVIQFVVTENGEINQVEVKRDIGAGCGDAAAKVVESMSELNEPWIPGKQRGRPVKVLFTLPVKFKLQG